MEPFYEKLGEYGGWFLFLGMVVKEVFPLFATRIFPGLQRKQQAEEDRQKMELEAKIAAEKDEQAHRHEMERRSVVALENQTSVLQSIREFMVSINDRLVGVENAMKVDRSARKTRKARSS